MARPFKISFVSDVAPFLRGTSDIESALDDVSDSLDDVSREAGRAGETAGRELADGVEAGTDDLTRRMEAAGQEAGRRYAEGLMAGRPADELQREFEQAADAAQREISTEMDQAAADVESATERMERSFRDAFDEVPRNAKVNIDRTTTTIDDGASRAKASMAEVKSEALQNASETFSSFDGSARSLVDGVQGTFGGIVSSLGPLGAAIGAAGAVGIGAITSALDKSKEKAQEFRDAVQDALTALREGGGRFEADEIAERLESLAEAAEDGTVALKEMNEAADAGRVDLDDYAHALASMNVSQLEELRDRFSEVIAEQHRLRESEEEFSIGSAVARGEMIDLMQTEIDRIDETVKARQEAEALKALLDEAGIVSAEARAAAEEAADERRQASADRVHERFTENAERLRETNQRIADSITSTFDQLNADLDEAADDGKVTLDELDAALEAAAAERQASAARWAWAVKNLTQEQIDVLLSMGESGEAALDTIMNSPPEATAGTLSKLQAEGEAKGSAERRGVVAGAGGPITIPIVPELDERAYQNLRNRAGQSVHMRIIPRVDQAV